MNEDWNKEFKRLKFPTIEAFLSNVNEDYSEFNIVIGKSVNEYPKYLIKFDGYLSYKSHEETGYEFDSFVIDGALKDTNSIFLEESDWLNSMSSAIEFLYQNKTVRHFVFAGGDNVVEVVSDSEPKVTIIHGPKSYEYKI